ncbi:MAG TPA: S-methyl-5-thioribose-1-phosphate isomerase [Planctomycetota bacterium]|nr:S-methyl-5-thioribose-1-phosphate isomerase [Planctomycetota bacterium]
MTAPTAAPLPPTIAWCGDEQGHLELLDQTVLPHQRVVLRLQTAEQVIDAIARLCVRGAPAIGVAAGYGLVLGVRQVRPAPGAFVAVAREVGARLVAVRPTAVNLAWAIERCLAAARERPTLAALLAEARRIHAEDVQSSERIGECGKRLVTAGATVLTHCNTGRLATAGDGTALAVLFAAWRDGVRFRVLADETRPLLQGARLTALELATAGIPVELLVDAAAPGLIARGEVQLVLVGADRIAGNGDFANKVGTYGLALACAAHRVPFYVAAPASTFDERLPDGSAIPIEERDGTEVLAVHGHRHAAPDVQARNPAFDVTPGRLVTNFVTDQGLLQPPFGGAIKAMFARCR